MTTVTFAVPIAPELVPRHIHAFLRALGTRVNATITLLPVCSYAGLAHAVETEACDLAWAPPLVALDLVSYGAGRVIASVVRSGTTSYPAVLVTLRGGRIRDVAELVGARVAWVSRLSAAGHVVPRMHLDALGVTPGVLGAQTFHNSHRAALDAVDSGRADVAATYARRGREGALLLAHESPRLHIMALAGWVPSDVVMATPRLPAALLPLMASALSTLEPDAIAPLAPLFDTDRFAVADDHHLDELRALTSRARVGRVASEAPRALVV